MVISCHLQAVVDLSRGKYSLVSIGKGNGWALKSVWMLVENITLISLLGIKPEFLGHTACRLVHTLALLCWVLLEECTEFEFCEFLFCS
jgi:hypothetical protein